MARTVREAASGETTGPLISIIIPAYKAERTLVRALRSVQAQTHRNWEALVVIDGAFDKSPQIARRMAEADRRIHVIEQENEGPASARNCGMATARGRYISFLDADDVWLPRKLEIELQTLVGRGTAFTYSWYYAFDEGYRFVNAPPRYMDSGMILESVVRKENLIIPSAAMLERTIYDDLGGFPTQGYHEDLIYFVKIAAKYPGFPSGSRLVLYQQSLTGKARAHLGDYVEACRRYTGESEDLQEVLDAKTYGLYRLRQRRTLFYMFLMYGHLERGRQFYRGNLKWRDVWPDLKGKLALLSLWTGLNLLRSARVLYQQILRIGRRTWWEREGACWLRQYQEAP